MLRLVEIDDKTGSEQDWMFSLMRPPAALAAQAQDRDLPRLIAQRAEVNLPGIRWLPLTTLIEAGRLHRMQDWPDQLNTKIKLDHFYTFISHRWLTATHPDPEGLQGGLIAWQMLAHLCEAVFVARLRGLHTPRRFSPDLHAPIGIAGSELAESLLVNVLRSAVADDTLPQLFEEMRSIEELFEDKGLEAAADDPWLDRLRSLLANRRLLTECASRINIWYDYSCMPQEPRTPAEQQLFEAGLTQLNNLQLLGPTIVLLDEVSDYLCRAWCALESVFADTVVPTPLQILNGSTVERADRRLAERHFREVLRDHPHLIWRGILDTEVFRIQSPVECMERLALDTTRPQDRAFVYGELRKLSAPRAIHIDESELVTGCFPLPVSADRNSVLQGGRQIVPSPHGPETASLDWGGCLSLEKARPRPGVDETFILPPLTALSDQAPQGNFYRSPCHVAIVASCEGEAAVVANWVLGHLDELAAIVGRPIHTMSWLASDIAPVGHFGNGDLVFEAIDAEVWALVTLSTRLQHCATTALLQRSLQFINTACFELALDITSDNVVKVASRAGEHRASRDDCALLALRDFRPRKYPGGVFRDDLLAAIAGNAERAKFAGA